MSQFLFTLVGGVDANGDPIQNVGVLISDEIGFKGATSRDATFPAILAALKDPTTTEEDLLGLFDIARGVERAVENANLSSRVAVENGQITLDGFPMIDALSDHILGLLREQSGDLTGWVRFLERVEANPNEHSRAALFSWLQSLGAHDGGMTTVAETGFLVGYKGVQKNPDGSLVSVQSGPAIVNGVEHKSGQVPNAIGSVIEMKRADVQHDPAIGCSRGLHVGPWAYAYSWARGAVLEVHVDPADVVSVPTDCDAQKMRCSKYTVVRVLDAPYNTATLPVDGSDEDNEDYSFKWDEDWDV